jgi:hypothetical protein
MIILVCLENYNACTTVYQKFLISWANYNTLHSFDLKFHILKSKMKLYYQKEGDLLHSGKYLWGPFFADGQPSNLISRTCAIMPNIHCTMVLISHTYKLSTSAITSVKLVPANKSSVK